MKITALNAGGLCESDKRNVLFNKLKAGSPDIIILVETKLNAISQTHIKQTEPYKTFFTRDGPQRGVLIMINPKSDIEILKTHIDPGGNYITLEIKLATKPMTITAVYGPNEDNQQFWEKLLKDTVALNYDKMIIMGDYNVVMDMTNDAYNYTTQQNKKARAVIQEALDSDVLADVYRELNPTKKPILGIPTKLIIPTEE